jgi:hypothetical protein
MPDRTLPARANCICCVTFLLRFVWNKCYIIIQQTRPYSTTSIYRLTLTFIPFVPDLLAPRSISGRDSLIGSCLASPSSICLIPSITWPSSSSCWSFCAIAWRYRIKSTRRCSVIFHSSGNSYLGLKLWCLVSNGTSSKVSVGSCSY